MVTNNSGAPLTLDPPSFPSAGGSLSPWSVSQNQCPATLPTGYVCTISVAFTPTIQNFVSGAIVLMSHDKKYTSVVQLGGTGYN